MASPRLPPQDNFWNAWINNPPIAAIRSHHWSEDSNWGKGTIPQEDWSLDPPHPKTIKTKDKLSRSLRTGKSRKLNRKRKRERGIVKSSEDNDYPVMHDTPRCIPNISSFDTTSHRSLNDTLEDGLTGIPKTSKVLNPIEITVKHTKAKSKMPPNYGDEGAQNLKRNSTLQDMNDAYGKIRHHPTPDTSPELTPAQSFQKSSSLPYAVSSMPLTFRTPRLQAIPEALSTIRSLSLGDSELLQYCLVAATFSDDCKWSPSKSTALPIVSYRDFRPRVHHFSPYQIFSLVYRTKLMGDDWNIVRSTLAEPDEAEAGVISNSFISKTLAKQNVDQAALTAYTRSLWNACMDDDNFDKIPYLETSRYLKHHFTIELLLYELNRHKNWISLIERYELCLREEREFIVQQGDDLHVQSIEEFVEGFRICTSDEKFSSRKSIELELLSLRKLKASLSSSIIESGRIIEEKKRNPYTISHNASLYITQWWVNVETDFFGKPLYVPPAMVKNRQYVIGIQSANMAALKLIDEIHDVESRLSPSLLPTIPQFSNAIISSSTRITNITNQTKRMLLDFRAYVAFHAGQLPRLPSTLDKETMRSASGALKWMFRLATFRKTLLSSKHKCLPVFEVQSNGALCLKMESWRDHALEIRFFAGDAFFDDSFVESQVGRGAFMGCLRGCYICESLWRQSQMGQDSARLQELERESEALLQAKFVSEQRFIPYTLPIVD